MQFNHQVETSTHHYEALEEHLEQEMKKQRLKFRFYRDYFGSQVVQQTLKNRPLLRYKLKLIFEAIRQEIKLCLYPLSLQQDSTCDKFERILSIEDHLNHLEYIKNL